jgi:hypothetical protein
MPVQMCYPIVALSVEGRQRSTTCCVALSTVASHSETGATGVGVWAWAKRGKEKWKQQKRLTHIIVRNRRHMDRL